MRSESVTTPSRTGDGVTRVVTGASIFVVAALVVLVVDHNIELVVEHGVGPLSPTLLLLHSPSFLFLQKSLVVYVRLQLFAH